MRIWAVGLVRDEADIIEYTLQHLASQDGIEGIIVADNLSTDGTPELMSRLTFGCELHVYDDHERGHYQARKMTKLAHGAFNAGADWVIPFDADELWHAPHGLRNALAVVETQGATVATALLHNYYPTSSDDAGEPNPFLRIRHRDPQPARLRKVAIRRGDVELLDGNHGVVGHHHVVASTLQVAHFPWRSWEQFRRKVINGAAALAATDLSLEVGAHWRQYAELLAEHGESALREVYDTWFYDPVDPVELAPAPWCRW